MSFWKKKIEFHVSGLSDLEAGCADACKPCGSESGRINLKAIFWSVGTFYVVGIAAAVALVFFAPRGKVENYGAYNVLPNRAADAVMGVEDVSDISDVSDVADVNFKLEAPAGLVVMPGGGETEVSRLKLFSGADTLRLRGAEFEVSGVDEEHVLEVSLYDEEGKVYKGSFEDGSAVFENLYLKVEPGEPTYYSLELNFAEGMHFGQRICVSLEGASALDLTMYGERVFVEKDYPVDGACLSVVGKQVVF